MQVLISGGKKTGNIIDVLKTRFRSGVDFSVENNISNIGNYYSRGNWFDRAIILEQSWTEDDDIEDETKIRENLHRFVMEVKNRSNTFEVIFVVTSVPEMAKIVLEESLDIMAYSKVLLKEPPYYASFFKNLVADDINKMPEKYVFDMRKVIDIIDSEDVSEDISWSTDREEHDTTISGPLLESVKESDLTIGMREIEDDDGEDTEDNDIINKELFEETGKQFDGDFDFEELQEMPIDEDDDSEGIDITGELSLNDEEQYTDAEDTEEYYTDAEDTEEYYTDAEDTEEYYTDAEDAEDTEDDESYSVDDMGKEEWEYDIEDNQDGKEFSSFDDVEDEYSENDIAEEELKGAFEFDDISENDFGGEFEDALDNIEGISNGEFSSDNEGSVDESNDVSEIFYGETGFEPVTPVDTAKKQHEKESTGGSADKLFNEAYYDTEEDEDKDETPIDYGISFKGIKGKGILSKTRYKAHLNNKNIRNDKDLHIILKTFLKRGNALTVTGGRCSGKTLVASNIANIVSKLGYTVLLVDMDTRGRGQSYITKEAYDTVHSGDTSKESLRKAINSSSSEIGRHVDIIRPGFHVLTTALGCDMEDVSEIIQPLKLNRFIHSAKTSYNFIIFDIPFKDLTTTMAEILFATDDIMMCVDTTNHGLMEFVVNMGNIESDDVKSTLFNMSQVLLNKVERVENVFGYKVKTVRQVLKALDMQMAELIGGEAEYLFKDLKICGVMKYNNLYEKYWFSKYQISDFEDGEQLFLDVLRKVLVKN